MWYIQPAERARGVVTREDVVSREGQGCSPREDVVYGQQREGQRRSHQRECGIYSDERVRGVVTREDVVYNASREGQGFSHQR
jgi:hypothetical protein